MCGRFNQPKPEKISKEMRSRIVSHPESELPLFNIGVGQPAWMVRETDGERLQEVAKFGYYKSNNKGGDDWKFNARSEGMFNKEDAMEYTGKLGIHTNPAFKESFKTSRVLIPVTSFIEGPKIERLAKPYNISIPQREVFALAGIADTDARTGKTGFVIITSWPNQLIKDVVCHHRSPVILDEDYWEDWLNPETDYEDMLTLLRPYHDDLMKIEPISPLYKSPAYHNPISEEPPAQNSLF